MKKFTPRHCPLADWSIPENYKEGKSMVMNIEESSCSCHIPAICCEKGQIGTNGPPCSELRSDADYLDCEVFGQWWWRGKYRQKFKEQNNKRRPIGTKLRHECFKRDNYKCKECGATNKEKILHADHILPVAQGGKDELSNLQTLCGACNIAKSNRAFEGGQA